MRLLEVRLLAKQLCTFIIKQQISCLKPMIEAAVAMVTFKILLPK